MTECTHHDNESSLESVYRVVHERRESRQFQALAVGPAILRRVPDAAHAGASVGPITSAELPGLPLDTVAGISG